jgi:signal transduction histidine kinase
MKNTILLVDDEKEARDILAKVLVDAGHTVHKAANGVEAVKMFDEIRPPIVMTDIKMPGMDGVALLKTIKRKNPETEVIMLTAHGDMNVAIQCFQNQALDFITKPVKVEMIHLALRNARHKIVSREMLRAYTENLEETIREKAALQDRLSSLGLMISSISHDLKGMMTGLDGGLHILNSGIIKDNPERVREGADIASRMAGRIQDIIVNVLDYSKKREFSPADVHVADFLCELLEAMETRTRERGVRFVKKIEPSLETFRIDISPLRSALLNVLENAADACEANACEKQPEIVFSVRKMPHHIRFDIEDNGVGMDAETQKNMFNLFFSTKGHKGTGLGLFIAHDAIKSHHGDLRVDSTPGKGTHVHIMIPKSPPQA